MTEGVAEFTGSSLALFVLVLLSCFNQYRIKDDFDKKKVLSLILYFLDNWIRDVVQIGALYYVSISILMEKNVNLVTNFSQVYLIAYSINSK